MTDCDQLLARAEAQRDAWKDKCHKAWDDVDEQTNRAISAELENRRLRAALATQAEPLFEGTIGELAYHKDFHSVRVVVYPAAAPEEDT